MTYIDQQFHRQQSRLNQRRGVRGCQFRAPSFSADVLCGIDAKGNRQRWLEYQAKLANQEVAA